MYENVCYKKNYIEDVICRLDFANPISIFNTTMPKSVYMTVKDCYPIAEPQDVIGTQFQVNPVTGPKVNNLMIKQWIFWSRDKKSSCIIDNSSIVFSVKNYNVFEDLNVAFLNIMKSVLSLDENIQGRRLGLRYINKLPLHGHDNWITEHFFKAIAAHKDDRTLSLITQLEYVVMDKDISVKLRYGYPNPDYPAVMKNEQFMIDIDAFSRGLIYIDDLDEMIGNMHSEVQACFEKMITDEYRDAMNSEELSDE